MAIDNVFDSSTMDSPVKLIYNPGNEPDHAVNVDPQRLCQVLINLLKNAQKFTEKGRITIDRSYDPILERLTISVSDTGIGIPASQAEKIFDRFHKIDNSAPGCGLGLYICRLIVQLMGGEIKLDTGYRGGSRFVFTIPA